MKTTILPLGMLQTNCYIVEDNQKHAIIIDPGTRAEKIITYLTNEGIKPVAIFLTHGHWDHVGAVDDLHQHYKIPVFMHEGDYELINNPKSNVRFNHQIFVSSPIQFVEEGPYNMEGFSVELIHAPGHSEGSMMLIYENQLFSGDVLFREDIGRTDLYNSNPSKMRNSLRVIKTLDPNLIVYPGHEESSSIAHELMYNPHLQ